MPRTLKACLLGLWVTAVAASPEADRLALVQFFTSQFPGKDLETLSDGEYAFDEDARGQWRKIEDFPPYEYAIEDGENLFNSAFANGKTYADCFENGGTGVRQDFPTFDTAAGEVITMEFAINRCRAANGEPPLPWLAGDLAAISSYMAYTSRDRRLNVKVPHNPAALAAYESGKAYYYTRRGQLEFACADCHVTSAGSLFRAERLSGLLGQATHWPVYRYRWGEIGTLHKRFMECNLRVRAEPYEPQSKEYRELEYFLSFMSNGMKLNGPASRR